MTIAIPRKGTIAVIAVYVALAIVLIACRKEEIISPVTEEEITGIYERLDAGERRFAEERAALDSRLAPLQDAQTEGQRQMTYALTELDQLKVRMDSFAQARPNIEWDVIDQHISGLSAVIVDERAKALAEQFTVLESDWEIQRAAIANALEEELRLSEAIYLDLFHELREEYKAMRQAYEHALLVIPPVPPNITFQQAPMPRSDVAWSLALEPRATQAKSGYGRISIAGIAPEDEEKVIGIQRLPIERRGRIYGYVQHAFPKENYWASMALETKLFHESDSTKVEGGVFFAPELPIPELYPCRDVAIFTSVNGGEWVESANGCNPQIPITGDIIMAVAVDVQKSN